MSGDDKPIPKHAAGWLAWFHFGAGALFGVLGALMAVTGATTGLVGGASLVGVAIVLVGLGQRTRRLLLAVPIINTASQSLLRGRTAEASALLDRVPAAAAREGIARRAIAISRATMALHEGRTDEVLAYADEAVAGKPSITSRAFEASQRAVGLTLRALALVSKGDAAGAERAAREAELVPEAGPDVLARAALVRALVLANANDMAGLSAHLTAHGSLLLEHTLPKERALVRVLRRMARARPKSVYREPSKPADAETTALASWVAGLAPDAAAFVVPERDARSTATEATPIRLPAPAARAAPAAAAPPRAESRSRARRVLVLWMIVAVLFLVVYQLLTSSAGGADEEATRAALASGIALWAPLAFLALLVGLFARVIGKQRRAQRELFAARRAAACGDPSAEARLRAIADDARLVAAHVVMAGAAKSELARLVEMRGDLAEATRITSDAIAQVLAQPGARAGAVDFILPTLHATRACALASQGREAEAATDVVELERTYAAYPFIDATKTRVALRAAIARGDLAAAAAAARSREASVPLPLRDEALADLALAASGELSKDERERLFAELADDPALTAWLDVVAPGLRDRASPTAARTRVADEEEAVERDVTEDEGAPALRARL